MKLTGTVTRSGKHWLAEIPALDAMTQGNTRAEALAMAAAWVRDMLDRQDLAIETHAHPGGFTLAFTESAPIIALMLRRRRNAAGLSLGEVAKRLGKTSRNAYARYENGESVPTIDQLDRLLSAVDSELALAT